MLKFYPSSSAFMLGDQVVTKYNSGCLRSILIKANGVRDGELAPILERLGKVAEAAHAKDLTDAGKAYDTELPIKSALSEYVEYSGRADFVVRGKETTVVHEVKGHLSKNTRRDVIRQGKYNPSHLAQLVSYMVQLRTPFGNLVCGYYEETWDEEPSLVRQEARTFLVEITDDGQIYVDDTPSGYSVADLLAHQRAAVKCLEKAEIGPRPAEWQQKYTSPCFYCPFKTACDEHDAKGMSTVVFLQSARDAVANAVPKKPQVAFKMKKPKKETAA